MKYATRLALLVIFAICTLNVSTSEARGRKKRGPRGPIIVHRMVNMKGTVSIDGVQIPEFAGIKEGNLVETAADSMALFRIAGLGLFRLGEKSQIKIVRYTNRDKARFEIYKGEFLAFIRRPGEHQLVAGDKILHVTDEATIRIRMNGKVPEICTCSGSFKLESRNQSDSAKPTPLPSPEPSIVGIAASPGANADAVAALASPLPVTPLPSPAACCAGIDLEALDSIYRLP